MSVPQPCIYMNFDHSLQFSGLLSFSPDEFALGYVIRGKINKCIQCGICFTYYEHVVYVLQSLQTSLSS